MIPRFWDYPFDGEFNREENRNLVETRVYMGMKGN